MKAGLCGISAALLLSVCAASHHPPPPAQVARVSFPADANVINVKAAPYNAAGNGTTDDTNAIQSAVYAAGQGQIIYFPAGTYLVSNTIWGTHSPSGNSKAWLRLQGQGQASTTILLKNNTFKNTANCAAGPYHGYTAGAGCQAVIYQETEFHYGYPSTYGAGLDAYMNSVQDMTINTGTGNPGAIGLDVLINNSGAIRNVTVQSGDGQGRFGIALTRDCCGGPGYLANITIRGFDYAIVAGDTAPGLSNPYPGYTLEHLHISGQKTAGIYNVNFPLWMRDLNSVNTVPALVAAGYGRVILVTGNLTGGSSSVSAVQDNASGGVTFLRGITTSGYQSALSVQGTAHAGSAITEYTSKGVQSQLTSATASLNLPVQETPAFDDYNFSDWVSVKSAPYNAAGNGYTDDTAAIQATLNSGKPVIYFPWGNYVVNGTLSIPSTVTMIEGLGSQLMTTLPVASRTGIVFHCTATSGGTKFIQDFHFQSSTTTNGKFTNITDDCTVPLVLKDNFDAVGYLGNTNNTVYWEDSAILVGAKHGGSFYGRQVNTEINGTHLEFDAATAWVLGWKTEGGAGGAPGLLWAHNKATVEMLGSFNMNNGVPPLGTAYNIQDSNVSLVNLGSFGGYTPSVSETRNGTTMKMTDTTWVGGIGFAHYSGNILSQASPTLPIPSSTKPGQTWTITTGSNAVDGGFGANGAVPAVQFYNITAGNPFQSWAWNGLTLQNVGYAAHYMADAGNGTVSEPATGDNWTLAASGSNSFTIRNKRTGNYLGSANGALAMSTTPGVWTLTAVPASLSSGPASAR